MSSFTQHSSDSAHIISSLVRENIANWPCRGGLSVIQGNNGQILSFGGVDRTQEHFSDLLVGTCNTSSLNDITFEVKECSGDIPTSRSGHSVVTYGRFMILFGGIDFTEEAVYNDLYLLDTDTWEWSYIGESGVEVIARNSQSMVVLTVAERSFLVIFGGASPEHGPLGDVCYAELPVISNPIDWKSISVHWQQLLHSPSSSSSYPTPREMHSTTIFNNMLLISGGRDSSGAVLSDCWSLHLEDGGGEEGIQPVWTKQEQLTLPMQTCAHTGIAITTKPAEEGLLGHKLVVFGGVTTIGINDTIISAVIKPNDENPHIVDLVSPWIAANTSSSGSLSARLGHASCTVSNMIEGPTTTAAILTIGGSDTEKDYNDAWLLTI